MTLTQSLLAIVVLIATSAFFSLAEITLAASRRLRLRQMADEGDIGAERVLKVQEQPGHYFTVVQIGLNAVAILGGVVGEEQQIVKRDDNSWLIDGVTLVQDVMRPLDIDTLPHADEYETLAGFLMVMLCRVPKRTDSVNWGDYTFEVVDVDNHRVDQVLVSRKA